MSLRSYIEIVELVEKGVIRGAAPENLNAASLDVRLGENILVEAGKIDIFDPAPPLRVVSLRDRTPLSMHTHSLTKEGAFNLYPGEFILAQSFEVFNLPNNIAAEYRLKSSMARIGLQHLYAGYCDPGWHGSVLTLELKNVTKNHIITLNYLDRIGQMIFFEVTPVPEERSYATMGRYNKDSSVSGVKK